MPEERDLGLLEKMVRAFTGFVVTIGSIVVGVPGTVSVLVHPKGDGPVTTQVVDEAELLARAAEGVDGLRDVAEDITEQEAEEIEARIQELEANRPFIFDRSSPLKPRRENEKDKEKEKKDEDPDKKLRDRRIAEYFKNIGSLKSLPPDEKRDGEQKDKEDHPE
jgi:hypothetical protein